MKFLGKLFGYCVSAHDKRLLHDLFDEHPYAISCIILEESGNPGGKVTLLRWWKTTTTAFFERTVSVDVSNSMNAPRDQPSSRFDDLLDALQNLGIETIGDLESTIRDGVTYSLVWGSKTESRHLYIDNPSEGTAHLELIHELKANTWS